jgi:hypothetical protein
LINGAFLSLAFISVLSIENPVIFAVVYCIGVGYGSGGSGMISMLECWKHFSPNSKGKVLGLQAASYGLGPALWTLLFTFLCNPTNEEPDFVVTSGATEYKLFTGSVASRVPQASAILGLIFACFFIIAIIIFPEAPAVPSVTLRESIELIGSGVKEHSDACPNLSTALKTWAFWSLFLNLFCGIIFGVFLINVYKNYGMTKYLNDQLMSSIGSVAAGVGIVSRVLFSSAMDHFSFRLVYGCNILLQLVVASTITLVLDVSVFLYAIWVAIGFFVFSGMFPAFIMESTRIFGNK